MNKLWKLVILCTSGLCFMAADTALADYVGLVHVTKADADTVDLCNNANGPDVPEPLDVCNIFAKFDNPEDRLISVGNADILTLNGGNPSDYYFHMFGAFPTSPQCSFIPVFPDLICTSFVAIGLKCAPAPPEADNTAPDGDFDPGAFDSDGHLIGGWFNGVPPSGQGDAGNYPDLELLIAQLSVPTGNTIAGTISVFALIDMEVVAFLLQEVNCFEVGEVCDPPDCDDGDACTDDECVGKVCMNTPIVCDDGDECTDDDCDPASGCTHDNVECDDEDECTDDGCDPASGCTHDNVECDDGDCCTDDDCDPAAGCTHDEVDCPEGQSCNSDNCMCEEIPCEGNEECDDGNACTDDICDGGVCSNPKINCPDDGNDCTDTVCDPDTGCGHENNNVPCDNGDDCTENDACSGGNCQPGDPVECNDGDACTDDGCDADGGCTHEPVECDDGDACTDDDCDPASGCTHEPVECDDGDCCTDDDCDPAGGCTHDPVDCPEGQGCNPDNCMCEEIPCESDKDCDDSNACTADECTPNGCTNDPISCDDGDACTDDGCDPDSGCTHTPTDCDDGDACNGKESCDPEDGCQPGTPLDCNDDNDCTDDGCDPGSGCTNVPDDDNECSDDNACTADSCEGGDCVSTDVSDCPEGEVCDPGTGECVELGELELPLDIKPRMCPNTVMRDSNAAVWAALLGSDDFDITQVRMSGLLLSRADGVGGSLAPRNLKFKDEGTPFDGELCDCHAAGRDQITDLRMKFKTDAMVEAFQLNDEPSGSTLELIVTGQLNDGTLIFGRDCILLVR